MKELLAKGERLEQDPLQAWGSPDCVVAQLLVAEGEPRKVLKLLAFASEQARAEVCQTVEGPAAKASLPQKEQERSRQQNLEEREQRYTLTGSSRGCLGK